MHRAALTHKVQSILWPVLEDRCDTRSVSGGNDTTIAQITGSCAGSGKKLSLSASWENLLSLVAAFAQVGHVLTALRADTSIHGQRKEEIASSSWCLSWDPIFAFSLLCL